MEQEIYQKRGWILTALMLTTMLAAMDSTIISTAIPHIVSNLGGFNKFSWVFSIYLLAQTITIPIYGKLTDIYGRKSILLIGIVVFLVGSLACAAAWNIESLIAFRAVQGLGAGSIMATVNTIAGDIYTVEERAKVQGYLSSIWGISAILGPTLGGALAEYIDWRWIFIINLPIGIVSIYFIVAFFKEKVNPKNPIIDYKGALLILLTLVVFFVFILEGGQSWDWISVESIMLFILFIVFLILTIRTEGQSDEAIMPRWLWKDKTITFTNIAIVGMGIVMIGPDIFLPTFGQISLGLGTIASGLVLTTMSLGWPLASALSGKLYLRIGFKETALIGSILVFIACISFLLIPRPQAVYLIVLNQILIGGGFGLLSTSSLVGLQSRVNWEKRGVVTGANVFARNLGQTLGAAALGAIFSNSVLLQMKDFPDKIHIATNDVMQIYHDPSLSDAAREFLRTAINFSMQHVYWGMSFFTLLIIICLFYVPSKGSIYKKTVRE